MIKTRIKFLLSTVMMLSLAPAITYSSDTTTDKAVLSIFEAMSSQVNVLLNLDLKKSPGPVVLLKTQTLFKSPVNRKEVNTAFSYIDTSRSTVRVCSGQTLKYVNNNIYDYWGTTKPTKAMIDYAHANKTFIQATSDEFCFNDRNRFYENMKNKINLEKRLEIVENMSLIFNRENALEVATSLDRSLSYLDSYEIKSASLDVIGVADDVLTNLPQVIYELIIFVKGDPRGMLAKDENLRCRVRIKTGLEMFQSSTGRFVTSPLVEIGKGSGFLMCSKIYK